MLVKVGGPRLAVALLATVVVLLVFGDRLVGAVPRTPASAGKDKDVAASPVVDEAEQRDEVVDAAAAVLDPGRSRSSAYDAWWPA